MFLEDSATPTMPKAALSALTVTVAMPEGAYHRPGSDMKEGYDNPVHNRIIMVECIFYQPMWWQGFRKTHHLRGQ